MEGVNKKAYICVVITAMLFGSMEVACKIAGNDLDPFQLTFLRFAVGGIVILPFAAAELRKNSIRLTGRDLVRLTGVGTLGIPISMVFFHFHKFAAAFYGNVHESALTLNADDFLDDGDRFSLIVQAHDRRLELLQKLAGSLEGGMYVLKQESAETALLRLIVNA